MRPLWDVVTPADVAIRPTNVCGAKMLVMMTPAEKANSPTGTRRWVTDNSSVRDTVASCVSDMVISRRSGHFVCLLRRTLPAHLPL